MLPFQRHKITHPCIQSLCSSLTRVHHSCLVSLRDWPHQLDREDESVQQSFTKRLPGLRDTFYADRLSILKLKSLEHHRLITDLVTCYNIIHDRCSLEFANFLPSLTIHLPEAIPCVCLSHSSKPTPQNTFSLAVLSSHGTPYQLIQWLPPMSDFSDSN